MNERPLPLPNLASLQIIAAAGPYAAGAVVSLAFNDPTLGRLAIVGGAVETATSPPPAAEIPDIVLGRLLAAAGPYDVDDLLVLSFVNPVVARIFPIGSANVHHTKNEATSEPPSSPAGICADVPTPNVAPANERARRAKRSGVMLLLRWCLDDARRFISVADKLFTVDRLGWFRHTLAMRLLLPGEIVVSDVRAAAEMNRHLEDLRTAATDALNAPLLSAFMPGFAIDAAWLETLEPPALIDSAARLRSLLQPHLGANSSEDVAVDAMLSGAIEPSELTSAHPTNLDNFIALLVPQRATDPALRQRLREYRSALLDLFGQMAYASATIRLKQMTSANHLLDERLWNLVGAFQDACVNRVA